MVAAIKATGDSDGIPELRLYFRLADPDDNGQKPA